MRRTATLILTLAVALLAPPLIGVLLQGHPVSPYLAFPPRTVVAQHAPFSWAAFAAVASATLVCLAPLLGRIVRGAASHPLPGPVRSLPWWGWGGLLLVAVSWMVAWTPNERLSALREHSFTPLWLGYTITVNALCSRRTGRCMLTHRPRALLALFPLSALFWWFFEFLNRFVQNWHYLEATTDAWAYALRASLAFSTVLPAVLSTRDYLASFPPLHAGLHQAWAVRAPAPRALAVACLLVGVTLLAALPVWPHVLFPLVWIAPLIVLVSLQTLWGRCTIFSPLARGDWSGLWLAALAAVLCGLFWELWNWRSLPRWEYTVPYVQRFHLFEMPLLGYAGYLPFGLQCLAAAQLAGHRCRP